MKKKLIPRPFITIKIINRAGKLVEMFSSRKIKRIYCFLQAEDFKDYALELCVRCSKNYINEGICKNKKDLIYALKIFTEKNLINDYC